MQINLLTSKENESIKACKKLVCSRKERQETGLFVIEGVKLCCEAAEAGLEIQHLFFTGQAAERYPDQIDRLLQQARITAEITPPLAEHLSDTRTPQGVFCICKTPVQPALPVSPAARFLLLDQLQDPGNVGTIIRTAYGVGFTAALLTADCPEPFSPKVLRSAMGSAFRLPLLIYPDAQEGIHALQAQGVIVYSATPGAGSTSIRELFVPAGGIGVVIGNEGNGVSKAALEASDASLYIPMKTGLESFNAAIAAAILMWEISERMAERR